MSTTRLAGAVLISWLDAVAASRQSSVRKTGPCTVPGCCREVTRWRIGRSITQTAERGILLDTTAEVDSIKDEQ